MVDKFCQILKTRNEFEKKKQSTLVHLANRDTKLNVLCKIFTLELLVKTGRVLRMTF